jgi:hypothetical protein
MIPPGRHLFFAFSGAMTVFALTGVLFGWGIGLVIATAAWLLWLALSVRARL